MSTLRALGGSYKNLKNLFTLQGLWIGFLGSFFGITLAGLMAWLLSRTQIFKFTKEVYLIEKFTVEFSPWLLLSIAAVCLGIVYGATRLAVRRLHRAPLEL
ncbi:MAG: FtsX-like permease family protein [bacterium]|nr:FtsX-like permease family protein [bacterium]